MARYKCRCGKVTTGRFAKANMVNHIRYTHLGLTPKDVQDCESYNDLPDYEPWITEQPIEAHCKDCKSFQPWSGMSWYGQPDGICFLLKRSRKGGTKRICNAFKPKEVE